jgi:hypothetical protein
MVTQLLECVTEVLHNLPIDVSLHYTEQCYNNLIRKILHNKGYQVNTEVHCCYRTPGGISFGFGKIDVLVETETEVLIIELKANVKTINRSQCQLKRYMLHFKTNKQKYGLLALYNCGYKPVLTINVETPSVKTLKNKILVQDEASIGHSTL